MQIINGRTPEHWRAFDRWKLTVALVLAALLVFMWIAGMGPGRAAACCSVPEAATAAVALPPATTPPETDGTVRRRASIPLTCSIPRAISRAILAVAPWRL